MCMCDRGEGYVCFTCEEFLQDAVKDLIHKYKNDILDSNDWWWYVETANDGYDINVFCYEDDPESPEALFNVNLYRTGHGFSAESQYDLPSMTRREIRLA